MDLRVLDQDLLGPAQQLCPEVGGEVLEGPHDDLGLLGSTRPARRPACTRCHRVCRARASLTFPVAARRVCRVSTAHHTPVEVAPEASSTRTSWPCTANASSNAATRAANAVT